MRRKYSTVPIESFIALALLVAAVVVLLAMSGCNTCRGVYRDCESLFAPREEFSPIGDPKKSPYTKTLTSNAHSPW